MKFGAAKDATAGHDDPRLAGMQEAARQAKQAGRSAFVARLPLPDGAETGDVVFWSAAVHQIERNGWSLAQWSVCAEPDGSVAYAVFRTS